LKSPKKNSSSDHEKNNQKSYPGDLDEKIQPKSINPINIHGLAGLCGNGDSRDASPCSRG
jgi:hypothetical protein